MLRHVRQIEADRCMPATSCETHRISQTTAWRTVVAGLVKQFVICVGCAQGQKRRCVKLGEQHRNIYTGSGVCTVVVLWGALDQEFSPWTGYYQSCCI
jgi:hypothetical protein